jgi:recombination protein RecT
MEIIYQQNKMENKTTTVATQQPMTAKSLFARDEVKKKFEDMLGKRATSFITSVLQIVASNKLLANADPASIYQAAAMAATLDLPLNNSLGFAYIIPYNQKSRDEQGNWSSKQVAQFQIGYKGFIQLAQRSGQFKTLSSTPIFEGQIVEANPLTGYVFDFTKRTSDNVIGYAAYFELINGFQKMMYMTIEEMKSHGGKYSKSFNQANGLWNTDFDSMANKTVLKLLLSKFAPLSVDMQKATVADQSTIKDSETMDVEYVDNTPVEVDKVSERIQLLIEDATTLEDLQKLESNIPNDLIDLYQAKKEELTPTTVSKKKDGK